MATSTNLALDGGLFDAREALGEKVARRTEHDNAVETAIPGLSLFRYAAPSEPVSYMHEPSICLIAQGAKRVVLGKETYTYDAYHFLITSVELPVVAQVMTWPM